MMGSSISHFYFVRSVLHLLRHIRNVMSVKPALPQEVVSELAYQTHLDRDRITHMFRVFMSMANPDGKLTPGLLSHNLPGWSANPLKAYLRRALFDGKPMTSFPELVRRVALFCPESKFSPAVSESGDNDFVFLESATSKRDRYARKRLLMLFRLTNARKDGTISHRELGRLIRCLLQSTIPDDIETLIPEKVIAEIATVVIVSVHERNEALCWAVCNKATNRVTAAAYESEALHRLVITKDMFLSELIREDLDC